MQQACLPSSCWCCNADGQSKFSASKCTYLHRVQVQLDQPTSALQPALQQLQRLLDDRHTDEPMPRAQRSQLVASVRGFVYGHCNNVPILKAVLLAYFTAATAPRGDAGA